MNPLVEAKDLEIAFRERRVLRGVSLSIRSGESVAIVGPNGAGKSTLVKILSRVLFPDSGEVFLEGDKLRDLSRRQIAHRVTTVPQSSPQVFDYGVMDFVLMGFYARSPRFALPSQSQLDEGRQALEKMGLGALADQSVSHLSGGELQRLLMARALVARAPLWLLDEPTANLDMGHQIALLKVMKDHVRKGGAALAILHDLAMVHRFFDRVLVLQEGRFLADGPPKKALTTELVSALYGVPMTAGIVDGQVVWVVK